jgi:CRP/FNR family transcriptional regulator, cyclic AMP receptor protein
VIERRQRGLERALATATLLRNLPPPVLDGLAAVARRRNYRRGEVICHHGDPGDALHVIESGRVKVTVYSDAGGELVLNVLGPGDCFGELALIDGEPRSATVETLEPVETVTLRRADFMRLMHENEAALEPLLATLARAIRRLSDAVADVSFLSLDARLAKKLLALAEEHGQEVEGLVEIQLPISQAELASMVGVTRTSVNKVLGQFEDQGLITRRGRRIVIRDTDRLGRKVL